MLCGSGFILKSSNLSDISREAEKPLIPVFSLIIREFFTFIREKTFTMSVQISKARLFHSLHHRNEMLILPNIWDTLGALLIEDIGYPAVATASASIAWSNGYADGEKIPFTELLRLLTRICSAVELPVTADIESGFAKDVKQLRENILRLTDTGISGINIEDTNHQTGTFLSAEQQAERIQEIRHAAEEKGVPLFINARTDVYLNAALFPDEEQKLNEVIRRASLYKSAGADGFFPVAVKKTEDISRITAEVDMPVNIVALQGVPDLKTLEKSGVKRVSLGHGFIKTSIKSMKELAMQLKSLEGLDKVTEIDIPSPYMAQLVTKKQR